jgi:hypothetical protein
VSTADQLRYLVRRFAQDVYTVTNRDLEKKKVASKAYANTVEAQLVAQIDSITRRFLSALAANPGTLAELKAVWTQQLQQLVDVTVGTIKADCGPNVFTVLSKDGKVSVYPASVRESQLRQKLVPYLGNIDVEAQA